MENISAHSVSFERAYSLQKPSSPSDSVSSVNQGTNSVSRLSMDLAAHAEPAKMPLLRNDSAAPQTTRQEIRHALTARQIEAALGQAHIAQLRAEVQSAQSRITALERAIIQIESAGGSHSRKARDASAAAPRSTVAPPSTTHTPAVKRSALTQKIFEIDAIGAHQDRQACNE